MNEIERTPTQPAAPPPPNLRLGYFCAIGAQLCWGVFPLYLYLLRSIDSFNLVAFRAIGAFSYLAIGLALSTLIATSFLPTPREIKQALSNRQTVGLFLLAALLIAGNWIGFVWGVANDHAVDVSLGYYICPQVVVLLGVVFLDERLKPIQWIAVGLAMMGVTYIAQSSSGVPWVALAVATSFGFYALVKKQVTQTALTGLTLETGFLLLPAIIFLVWRSTLGGMNVFGESWSVNLMLLAIGFITAAPLAMYAVALKHIPLSTMGFLQFLGPTMQFFIGVFFFEEPFERERLIGFVFVWTAVAVFILSLRGKPIRGKLTRGKLTRG